MEPPVDPRYWTSLEELAGAVTLPAPSTPGESRSDVRRFLDALPSVDRRSFLKLIGASLAAGALAGCRRPVEKIVPYLNQPVEILPSVASWYATTCHGCSAGCGVLAKVVDGRPIKLEGNPDHGVSRGGLCAVGQAACLSLYDAYRQQTPAIGGKPASWEQVDREVSRHLAEARAKGGSPSDARARFDGGRGHSVSARAGQVVLLTGTLTGPATRAVIRDFLATFPQSEHVVYDPVSYDAIREAHARAYGRALIPGYRFDRAEVIVSFGADFLGTWLSPVEFTKQYAAGRSPDGAQARMSRHFQFEARLSLTGSNADRRVLLAPSKQADAVAALAVLVARGLGLQNVELPSLPAGLQPHLVRAAEALLAARGRSLVVSDSPEVAVQERVLALNELLGNVGTTVDLKRPSLQKQGRDADMARLLARMQQGEVAVLLIHGCNPVYTFPEADTLVAAMSKVPCVVSFALTPDETARVATYHCPTHHPMEAWGDAEPKEGCFSLFQPTIRPLYDTRAFEESLLRWSGREETFYDYLRQYWKTEIFPRQREHQEFVAFWDQMLQRGYLELPVQKGARPLGVARELGFRLLLSSNGSSPHRSDRAPNARARSAEENQEAPFEVEVFESVALRDGAPANNPWLQELPDPITKIAWDNAALLAPALARALGVQEGQWIEIRAAKNRLRIPAHIQPGQHPRTISVALGYGRTHAGPVGSGVGVNAYPLSPRGAPALPCDVSADPSSPRYLFARTQIHASLEGRPIVREMTLTQLKELGGPRPSAGLSPGTSPPTQINSGHAAPAADPHDLWPKHDYPEYRWGMVIDLTRCVGCSACVTACDLENNVPVVGRDEVARQREMHWLRIDRYYAGNPEEPLVTHQPMLCQQCANAPCEVVCPVLATVHDDQGLNVQVYNRCVGTRLCSNNCPYKVRRFNFFDNISNDLTRNLALNPDVTVRSRGIMEKCSFCIQRIQAARVAARRGGRKIADGEVRTACEQSCPADAIVFGNLADPESRVSRLAASSRSYRVLEELNRKPAVYYLARVWNRDEQDR